MSGETWIWIVTAWIQGLWVGGSIVFFFLARPMKEVLERHGLWREQP